MLIKLGRPTPPYAMGFCYVFTAFNYQFFIFGKNSRERDNILRRVRNGQFRDTLIIGIYDAYNIGLHYNISIDSTNLTT